MNDFKKNSYFKVTWSCVKDPKTNLFLNNLSCLNNLISLFFSFAELL